MSWPWRRASARSAQIEPQSSTAERSAMIVSRDNPLTLGGSLSHGQSAAAAFNADFARVPLWKRILDISCVLIAIPSLLASVLLIAIAIKVSSKGPVLFKQERVGFLGKRFVLFKFRTMIAGADASVHEAYVASLMKNNAPMTKLDARGDARLIPFGRLLRAAGLDELPQVINVLRGEMSFVGPRPGLPSEYNAGLPWQRERLRTPPGLTGLGQVSGKNRTTFSEMIDFDIQYIRKQSLWLDLKIMLKTIPAVIGEVRDIWRPAAPALPSDSTNQTLQTEARTTTVSGGAHRSAEHGMVVAHALSSLCVAQDKEEVDIMPATTSLRREVVFLQSAPSASSGKPTRSDGGLSR